MKKYIWITLLVSGSIPYAYAQIGNKGVPSIRNFTYEQYQAGAQNRCILQDDQGNMLFGNNYGLLEYNGKSWSLIVQPSNKTVVWSIHKDKNGTIYLGAQNEFGYVKTNDAGQKRYISLLPKIPQEYRHFSDIWAILETSEGIYFHSADAIYRLVNDTIQVLKTPPLGGFSKVGDSILVQDGDMHIHVVKPEGLRKVIDGKTMKYYVLKIFDDNKDGMLFITPNNGILKYRNGKFDQSPITNTFLKENKIHSLHRLRNNYLAMGSVGAGLLILDESFQPIQWLNKGNGLQSNTILAMGTDHIGNLWVATETGIDYVEIATPLYKIADHYHLEGTVSSTLISKDMLYVGTNTGVYYSHWEKQENPLKPKLQFRRIEGISGQVWNLYEIEGSQYVCHHDGLYKITGNRVTRIFGGTGSWNLLRLSDQSPLYLQGAYNGIHLFEYKDGRLAYQWKIEGFDETSRIIQMDQQGNLWMAHGYKGIYRLRMDGDLKTLREATLYTQENGFPTSLFINLFKVKNKILFGTEYGTYQYDYQRDSMVQDPLYTSILGSTQHIRLLQEDQGKVWFIMGRDMQDEMGIIDFYDSDKFEVTKAPLQHLRGKFNPGFENITVVDKNTVLFGTKNGIILQDRSSSRNYNRPYKAHTREVRCIVNDSLLFGQPAIDNFYPITPEMGLVKLPYDLNSINFSYASDYFESPENTRYSYFLEGFDKSWHEWSPEQSKRFTNLNPGSYTFHIKAQNVYGVESEAGSYPFTILPPWYWSTLAKGVYGILGAALMLGLRKAYKRRIERAQRKERLTQLEVLRKNKQQHLEEKLLTQQELITLRNEKLEAEIEISRSKMEVLNAEMAASIMMITQKNSVLMKVRDDLGKLHKKAKDSNKVLIDRVIRHINKDIDTDQDWHQFKIHFDKVHEDFLERLKQQFPDLSPKDLQLAAYIRLNLSSKEIASMMNITIRSIEGCRYRLRKHLNLSGQTNLNEYLIKF